MSATDAVKQLEQQLEQLKKKVTEEAEHKRQQEEAARKREEERAQAKKRKAPESDDESDSAQEVEQELGLLVPRRGCERCCEKGVHCTFRPGKRNSTCVECQRLKIAPCVGVKGLSDPELQARVDCKAAAAAVDPRKRAKKSDPTVDDDDNDDAAEYAPPRNPEPQVWQEAGEGEGLGEVNGEEHGEGEGKGEGPGEGPATLALAREGRAWSTDPESLSDRELIEHLLVGGQRTRLALHQVWRYLNEEIEVREDVFASALRNIRAGVQSSVCTELSKMEAVVRGCPDAEKEGEAAMEKEGEGSGTGAGEREKEGEKEASVQYLRPAQELEEEEVEDFPGARRGYPEKAALEPEL
ncbi:hypothetical protein BN946_scf184957.g1 [Trametes cinnabarina]|uniref:Uncharacterized protein n=1 Tax=Pycnoporus cinnabarinus TaxID=5643 RepID=A0A060SB32_PYCCI|nr:hypothetical protein BN946_scf184957.g1 [Trametes cinnabarina]